MEAATISGLQQVANVTAIAKLIGIFYGSIDAIGASTII
jgi:hypothetical protein